MTKTSVEELETRIMTLLETEEALLMQADFENLDALNDEKEALVAQLRDHGLENNPKQTEAIRTKAQRNAQLYDATLSGLNQAITRISDIRSTLGKMTTYDGRGLVTTTDTGAPSVSVKA